MVLILICSSTHERKSKTAIFVKNGKIYLKHNSIAEDIPVVIFMKVFGDIMKLEAKAHVSSW